MTISIKTLMLVAILFALISIPLRAVFREGAKADLVMAVERGDLDRVEKLLKIHDVNVRISGLAFLDSNSTLLMLASKRSNVEMVRLLLKQGADPTLLDNSEFAAIHYVAENHNGAYGKSIKHLKRDLEVLNDLVACTPQLKPSPYGTPLSKARYLAFTSKQHRELYDKKVEILAKWIEDRTAGKLNNRVGSNKSAD